MHTKLVFVLLLSLDVGYKGILLRNNIKQLHSKLRRIFTDVPL
jgi:hypothetical protein